MNRKNNTVRRRLARQAAKEQRQRENAVAVYLQSKRRTEKAAQAKAAK